MPKNDQCGVINFFIEAKNQQKEKIVQIYFYVAFQFYMFLDDFFETFISLQPFRITLVEPKVAFRSNFINFLWWNLMIKGCVFVRNFKVSSLHNISVFIHTHPKYYIILKVFFSYLVYRTEFSVKYRLNTWNRYSRLSTIDR